MLQYFVLNHRHHSNAHPPTSNSDECSPMGAILKRQNRKQESPTFMEAGDTTNKPAKLPEILALTTGHNESSMLTPTVHLAWPNQLLIYGGIVIGVAFSSAIRQLQAGKTPTTVSLEIVGITCVIGLVISPQVYEKLQPSTDKPLLVQIGIAV